MEKVHENRKNNQYTTPLQMSSRGNLKSFKSSSPHSSSRPSPRTPKYSKYFQSNQTIAYEEFVKVVLFFQLDQHSKMIETINKYFKQVDTDMSGSINRDQLFSLLDKLEIDDENTINCIVEELDPHHLDYITYSQFLKFSFDCRIPIDEDSSNPQLMSLVDMLPY